MNKKEIYQKFCEKHSDIPIFSQPWYLDAVAGEDGWDILISMRGQEIAATMPIEIRKKYTFKISGLPHMTKYLGPYISPIFRKKLSHQHKVMKGLIEQIPKFDYFEQNFHPNINNWLPFYWANFWETMYYTFVFESLDNLDEIYNNIDASYRNNSIPKAQKIVKITTNKTIEDFYNTQEKTYKRQKLSTPFSFDFFKKYDTVLKEKNAREIFFAVDDKDQIHSVVYLIWDNETAYYHMAGGDPDLRNSGAGILLTWHVIKYTKEVLGLNRFDFEGSIIEPITKVRKKFGAKQVPYHNVRKYRSVLFRILQEFRR